MNKGIIKAKGEYLNFMNSGDCFYDNEVLSNVYQNGMCSEMIVGKDYHFDEKTEKDFSSILPIEISSLFLYVATLPHQSTFFKKQLFDKFMYDENLKIVSDWKFYIQQIIINGCSVQYYNNNVCRREPDGICSELPQLMFNERNIVLKELYPIGIRNDFDRLCLLEKDVIDKLFYLCKNLVTRKTIKYLIRIIYKIDVIIRKYI